MCLHQHSSYSEVTLLSATQSILILLIVLFFSSNAQSPLPDPEAAQLLIVMWEVKRRLAGTGLFLEQELNHTRPEWRDWALVSAKRRTILALHHLEWAWSVRHGYPELSCLELGPLPAPAAKYLWQEHHEQTWELLYETWLTQWKAGLYTLAETFPIRPGADLDIRTETWLAEADEFGLMIMGEG